MSNVRSLGVGTMRSRIARRPIESADEATVEDRPSVIAKDAASAAMSSEPRRWLMFAVLVCGTLLTPLDYFIVSFQDPSGYGFPIAPDLVASLQTFVRVAGTGSFELLNVRF